MGEWILRGRDHLELAAIELQAEAAAAIALSRGGAKKTYAHTEPNEDAALLVVREARLLLAVADGHGGWEAAEIALETLRGWSAELPERIADDAAWRALALGAFLRASERIGKRDRLAGGRLSRTTLALALVDAPRDAIRWASMGDSHVFHAADGVLDLAQAHGHDHPGAGSTYFLGYEPESEASLARKVRIGAERLAGTQALVLVTDGLSERGIGVDEPEDTVAEAVQAAAGRPEAERAAALASGVVAAAVAAHKRRRSGDNVAAAAAWLRDLRAG